MAVSVRGHGGKKHVAVVASLADLVGEQVRLAHERGVFTPPRGMNKIPMLVCAETTPLWRAAATRCDVFVGVRLGGPASAGNPHNWVTWWLMDGSEDCGRLCAMDAEAVLNTQIEHLWSNCNVPLEEGTVVGYEVGMTGNGKCMQVANYSRDGKCWSCDDHDSLERVQGVNEQRGGGPSSGPSRPLGVLGTMPMQAPVFAMQPKRGCNKMSPLGCKMETVRG